MAREQAAPLVARIKELEEELTRVAGEWDTFKSSNEEATVSAIVVARQLGAKQGAHALTKGALDKALKMAETSQVDALAWKTKCEGESYCLCLICFSCVRPLTARCGTELEKEASRAAGSRSSTGKRGPRSLRSRSSTGKRGPRPLRSKSNARKRRPRVSPVGLCPCLAYFSFALDPILLVWAQGWRKRLLGWLRL